MSRTISIGFSKARHPLNVISWLIRAFDRTSHSHTYISWETSWGEEIVYEASATGVNFKNHRFFKERSKPVKEFRFELSEEQYADLLKLCVRYAGLSYGHTQLLGYMPVRLGLAKRNYLADGLNSMVCVEFVVLFLTKILKHEIHDGEQWTLKTLDRYLTEHAVSP